MNQIILNQDQEAAAAAVFQFLMSDQKETNISGPAGTGKTTLMHHITRTVLKEYEQASKLLGIKPVDFEVVLTATTNKATEVLTMVTGFPAQTIHSFMNLKVFDDYETGISKIRETNAWKVHTHKLIFVDEASMVDSKLHHYILKGTDKTCKIIYLGDHCQLAPVREIISPVYADPNRGSRLETAVRNAGQPALVDLCAQLRQNVETLNFKPILPVPGVIDYLDANQAQSFIDQAFLEPSNNARILCYSNNRVNQYNQYIRNLRGYPDHFVEGEYVINNVGLEMHKTMLRVEEEFKVVKVDPTPITLTFADGNAEIDVYKVRIANKKQEFVVQIPIHQEHYKNLVNYFRRAKDWKNFYWLKNNFPDLRPKDAATVYKAQGSTYDAVLLDLDNIGKCTDYAQTARMLYVGASRPTTRLFLYGSLPDRFRNRTLISSAA